LPPIAMSKQSSNDILKSARRPSRAEQIKFVDELAQHTARGDGKTKRCILDLEGLGKELWQKVRRDGGFDR